MRMTHHTGNHKRPRPPFRHFLSPVALAALLTLGVTVLAATTFLTVSPTNLQGWQIVTTPGTLATPTTTPSVTFVTGPGTPPLGTGSAEMRVGSDGDASAQLRHPGYAGTRLPNPTPQPPAANELSSLSYSTYVQGGGSGGQAPYINLLVDYNNDNVIDDQLFFEPVYQSATFCPSNPQPPLVTGQWQTWDAFNGCWWSLNNTAGAGPGTGTKPLRVITAAQPNAHIVNASNGLGGLRIVAGFGAGLWDNFVGNVDAFRIGVGANDTVYNFDPNQSSPTAGSLIIAEYRLAGPGGPADEFIEVFNNTDTAHVVSPPDGSAGYTVAGSDGQLRCTIPFGTVLPPRGTFLCVNSAGYSLGGYPSGNNGSTETFASGDSTYTPDIPDNGGVALFSTSNPANYNAGTRLDAVGSTAAPALYREGAGHPPITNTAAEHSFVRRIPGACTGSMGGPGDNCNSLNAVQFTPVPGTSYPQDTDSNAADFIYVDTQGSATPAGTRLGAPGPQNLTSPRPNNGRAVFGARVNTAFGEGAAPNRVRDTGATGTNASKGTLEIRRRYYNATGAPITRLRFRIIDFTTFPALATVAPGSCAGATCVADLRAMTAPNVSVTTSDPGACATTPGASSTTAPCNLTVFGTTLEQPPTQPLGGGFNSTLSAGTITLAAPLQDGQSINVNFLFGVEQNGKFRFFFVFEALPL